MSDDQSKSSQKTSIPASYWRGQELDWEAPSTPVELRVELPYWLMVPDCVQDVEVNGHKFAVDINAHYEEIYANVVLDSRRSCIHIGPPTALSPKVQKAIDDSKATILPRKCKTFLRIHSDCNKDVLVASNEHGLRKNSAYLYLKSFCEGHLEVINRLIQQYRLSTYDYFPYELSPWDVAVWFVCSGGEYVRIVLQEYAEWDRKPVITNSSGAHEQYKLIEPSELQAALTAQPSEGEFELLDALNFMERGDYSDAVRRITTAIEAQTESVLRQELLKRHALSDVERRLKASENDFPGRLRQYQKLSHRKLPAALNKELEITRTMRHSIVHRGRRIAFSDRGQAQRSVDTGRWIFNWLENQRAKSTIREKKIKLRSLGRHHGFYKAEITPAGVIMHKPQFPGLK
jgi:hypothetical protein